MNCETPSGIKTNPDFSLAEGLLSLAPLPERQHGTAGADPGRGKERIHITCTGVDNLQISGTSLTIDLSGVGPDLLGDYDFFSFTFSEGNSTAPLIWQTWQSRPSTAIKPTRAMPTPKTGP
mgnify:CR=1 FL=1